MSDNITKESGGGRGMGRRAQPLPQYSDTLSIQPKREKGKKHERRERGKKGRARGKGKKNRHIVNVVCTNSIRSQARRIEEGKKKGKNFRGKGTEEKKERR